VRRRLPFLIARAQWLGVLALVSLVQLVFWQESTDPFAPVELFAVKLLVPLCVWPLLASVGGPRTLAAPWTARLVLAWVFWLGLCALLSPYRADGLKTALEYGLEASVFFLPAALDRARRLQVLAAFVGASFLAAVYGLSQHFGLDPLDWSTEFAGRPLGTIGNPDFFGGHLVLAWGLALGWLLSAGKGRRLLPLLVLGAISLEQVYSKTVGAWLGMACVSAAAAAFLLAPAGSAALGRLGWTRKGLALVLAGLLLGAGLGLGLGPGARALGAFTREKSLSVVNRTMMWRSALRLWREAPIQGAGLCSFRPEYPRLQAAILAAEPDRGWNYVVTWLPHENFLYLLSETGLIGLALFLGLWGLACVSGLRRAGRGDGLSLAALLAASGMLGVSLLNTFSNIAPTAVGFFFVLGLMAWPEAAADPGSANAKEAGLERAAACLLVALALGVPAGRELAANRLTREAGRAVKRGDSAAGALFYGRAADLHIVNFTMQSLVGVNFQLANCLRSEGNLDAAVAAYRADLADNPWAAEGHNMLGAALGQLGQGVGRADWVDEGAQHLRTAVWLCPGYTAALLNLGGSYAMLGNVSGAAQAWEGALRSDPGNAQAAGYLAGLRARKP
jgi:O-antigen ligase